MRLTAGIVILIALAFVLAFCIHPASAQTVNCTVNEAEMATSAEEQDLWSRVNAWRVERGFAPFTVSEPLTRASVWHATDMAQHGYRSQTDSLGRSPILRAANCGFGGTVASSTDDYGWPAASYVISDWRVTLQANQAILNSAYTEAGIAYVIVPGSSRGRYWVITMGGGAAPTVTPTATNVPPTATPVPPTVTPTPVPPTATPTLVPETHCEIDDEITDSDGLGWVVLLHCRVG